jgi:hypothetical protein
LNGCGRLSHGSLMVRDILGGRKGGVIEGNAPLLLRRVIWKFGFLRGASSRRLW